MRSVHASGSRLSVWSMGAWHATMSPNPERRKGVSRMFGKDLITLLLDNPLRLSEIVRLYAVPVKEVLDDVKHLRKMLKHSAYRLDITAAECRKCGFVFSTEKLAKPSKCPQCRSTWLEEPVVQITET